MVDGEIQRLRLAIGPRPPTLIVDCDEHDEHTDVPTVHNYKVSSAAGCRIKRLPGVKGPTSIGVPIYINLPSVEVSDCSTGTIGTPG
jgi:hypothetical protein